MSAGFDRRRIAVASAGLCSFLDLYCTHAVLPSFRAEFGVGEAWAAATVSATTLAVAGVAPIIGHLADRFGRKRVIVLGALLMAIPTALAGTATDIWHLIGWRFLQGLFLPAVFSVTTAHIGEEWPPSQVPSMIGIHMAGMVVGGFLGRYLTALLAEWVGWRLAFPGLALVNLVGAGAIMLWMPRDKAPPRATASHGGGWTTLRGHLGNGRLLATCGIGFALLFSVTGTYTYVNFLLAEPPYSFGPVALGNLFAVMLLGLPASAVGVPLARKWGRRWVVLGAVALAALGLVTTMGHGLGFVLVGMALFTFGLLVTQPLVLGQVGQLVPTGRAMAVGLYVSCYYLGGSAGGVLPAWAWHHFGWPGCAALMLVMQAVMALLTLKTIQKPQ